MRQTTFQAITSAGGLLPPDFLQQLLLPKPVVEGLAPVSYHLAEGEKLNEQVNRSWSRLKGCWENFNRAIASKGKGESTTTDTRDRWLYPLLQELGFGRPQAAKPVELNNKSFPISHFWQHVPIHLVGTHVELDTRTPGAVGAAKASPHSLVQQVLNAREDFLWAILSNGFALRLMRDNVALTRLAYVEWDLQAIFDGDLFSEFLLLWLVCHQSRFELEREGAPPQSCWLEKWKKAAEDKGLRALENLRPGVKAAISALGRGFISYRHPNNDKLRQKLRSGELSTQGFYQQILREVYRLLFLFVAEERELLHPPLPKDDPEKEKSALAARKRYQEFYSTTSLRELSPGRAGTPHPDLWHVFRLVTQKLGSDAGCPELALPALGSFLWNAEKSTPDINDCLISNRHFLEAIRALAFVQDGSVRRAVDYKNLGAEELGSIYEGLLELHPEINPDAESFELKTAAGNERKTSGSYYTPDSLVQCLLDSALEPVIAQTIKGKEGKAAADALLKLKICDPAVGSGHFLIAAAHRLAKHVAAARSGEGEPSPEETYKALRDVVGHCLYGVDINPMSAELCRVSLWLEALEPGKPLSFLDHHIRVGNSLLGAIPKLIAQGIPDDAYKAIEGDNTDACAELRKRNKKEREGIGGLFAKEDAALRDKLRNTAVAIDEIADSRPEDIHRKEAAFQSAQSNYDFQKANDLADLWCAAFVIKKDLVNPPHPVTAEGGSAEPPTSASISEAHADLFGMADSTPATSKAKRAKKKAAQPIGEVFGITTGHLQSFVQGGMLPDDLLAEAKRLADQYRFFHWHLVFPEVFASGGFTVVLGNPPWERLKLEEDEFFAASRPAIANATTSSQRQPMIEALKVEDPYLYRSYLTAVRKAECESRFVRTSGLYPLCGHGDVNTYALFAELNRRLISSNGRLGCVLQAGIATDKTTCLFFEDIIESQSLVSFLAFDNKDRLFPAVKTSMRFCLLTVAGGSVGQTLPVTFVFYARSLQEAFDPQRQFTLTPEEIALLNPNTKTCPVFLSRRDADLVTAIYRRVPILVNEKVDTNPWNLRIRRLFDMNDKDNFSRCADRPELISGPPLPVYEAKLIEQFGHLQQTYSDGVTREISSGEKKSPYLTVSPRRWMSEQDVKQSLPEFWDRNWLLTWQNVTDTNTMARTVISAIIPLSAADFTLRIGFPGNHPILSAIAFTSTFNSFVFDYVTRQKLGGVNLSDYIVKQLPMPAPSDFVGDEKAWKLSDWIRPRVLELTFTAWNLEAFAQDCGWFGPPFRWDEKRRFQLRCELDAAFFHLYGLNRDDTAYILDTFPIVKRKDEERFGTYRTKDRILELYDALAESQRTGQPYQTELAPIPSSFRATHPPRLPESKRVALESADKFLLSFVYGFLKQTHEEATFGLLDSVFHLLRQRTDHASEFVAAVGESANTWLSGFNDKLPNDAFLPFLKRLEADGWITADRNSGRLTITDKFPSLPFDSWRNYDVSAALRVIAERPEVAELVTVQPNTALSSHEFRAVKTA